LRYAFGEYEFDGRAGDLYKKIGAKVRLTAQLSQLLDLLLANFPNIVTHEEIRQRLWPGGSPADPAHSIRIAIRRLREELADSPDRPGYIETVPQRGYRWMVKYKAKDASRFSLARMKWLVIPALLTSVIIVYSRRPSAEDAYNAGMQYQSGVYSSRSRRVDDLRKSIDSFQQSIDLAPKSGKAYAGQSTSYVLLSFYGGAKPGHAIEQARKAYRKAFELSPVLSETYAAHGEILETYDWDWKQAEDEYAKAIGTKTPYGTAYLWYARCLAVQGKFEPALKLSLRAQESDRESLIAKAATPWFRMFMGQYQQAISELELLEKQNPTFVAARWRLGLAYQLSGRSADAIKILQEETDPDIPELATLGYVLGLNMRPQAAGVLQQLRQLEKESEADAKKYVSPYWMAVAYAGSGDSNEAFKYLSTAFEQKDGWLEYLKADPVWGPIRSDPRYAELVRKLGL